MRRAGGLELRFEDGGVRVDLDQAIRARQMARDRDRELDHFRADEHVHVGDGEAVAIPAIAPQLSATPGRTAWPGPPLGAHNDDVYGGLLGLPAEALADLRSRRVI